MRPTQCVSIRVGWNDRRSPDIIRACAFVADIANFMGLKAPSSSWIYPKVFVSNMRKINTGHPEAANELVSENLKEMSNPTRDVPGPAEKEN